MGAVAEGGVGAVAEEGRAAVGEGDVNAGVE